MKFVLLFLAVAQAIKLDAIPVATPAADEQKKFSAEEGARQHGDTMDMAGVYKAQQIRGVKDSASDQSAYNVAHGCSP